MPHVLIVDDREDERYLLRYSLLAEGFQVSEAADGGQALEVARTQSPDLVVSDVFMPRMDGFELCRQWHADRLLKSIPFIFCTANYTDPRDERLGLSLGASAYVHKPLDLPKFITLINDTIARDRPMAEAAAASDLDLLRGHNEALIRKLDSFLSLRSDSASEQDERLRESESARRALLSVLEDQQRSEEALRQSEERLQAIVDSAIDGIITIDQEGVIVQMNVAAEQMFGVHDGTAIGRRLAELAIPPAQRAAHDRGLRRVLETGEATVLNDRLEMTALRSDGTEFPIELAVTRVRTDGPALFAGHVRDITERQRAEAELVASEARYADLYENSPDMMLSIDAASATVLGCNQTLAETVGLPKNAIVGKPVTELFTEESRQRIRDTVFPFFQQHGRVSGAELTLVCLRGSTREVVLNATAVRDEAGNIRSSRSVLRDVTEQKAADRALRESERRYSYFVEQTQEGFYRLDFDPPIDVDQPHSDVIRQMYERGVIAECNDIYSRMYGFEHRDAMRGVQLVTLHGGSNVSENVEALRQFIDDGYQHHDVETIEFDKNGKPIYLSNNTVGIIENGMYLSCWGTQRDITERKLADVRLRDSEERFRTVFDQQFQFMAILSPEGRVLEVNDLFVHATGGKRDDFVGKLFWELPSWKSLPEWRDKIENRIAQAASWPGRLLVEDQYLADDGELRHADAAYTAIRDTDGEIRWILAQATDVTERKRAEARLDHSREQFRSLVEAAPFGVQRNDLEGRITFANEGMGRIYGCPAQDLVGKSIWDFAVDEQHRAGMQAYVGRQVAHVYPVPGEFETKNLTCDGRVIDVYIDWTYDRDAEGNVVGFIVVLTDVTERNRAARALRASEEQLRRLNAELEQRVADRTAELADKNSELQAFTYSVSHDLRAPLRAMEGFAHALAEDYAADLCDDAQDYVDNIVQSARRMDQLVSDLLAYSQLGERDLRPGKVPLNSVVSAALEQLDSDVALADARIDVAADMPSILGHKSTLIQAVANMLGNAIKFVEQGVRPEVHVWAEPATEGRARLWVEDNGIGIDEEYQTQIFSMCERLHGVESYEGTGIGLAIVARACERLNGRFGVESERGVGSRFWVEFPVEDSLP